MGSELSSRLKVRFPGLFPRSVLLTQIFNQKEGLSLPEDQEDQFPVNYAYDYLNGGIGYLLLPTLKLNDHLQSKRFLRMGQQGNLEDVHRSEHAIDIFPLQAGLPWATGILSCRQNKYWQLTLDTTRVFLALFAADEAAPRIFKSGKSISQISRKELGTRMEEGWVKFPSYLFSEGDRQRTRLLAVVNVFIFVFDGKSNYGYSGTHIDLNNLLDFWEMHAIDSVSEYMFLCQVIILLTVE